MAPKTAKAASKPDATRRPAYLLFALSLIVMATSAILLLSECGERFLTARYWRNVARERDRASQSAQGVPSSLRSLHEQNPDIVGWISMNDSAIDYPVMQTPEEPEYYLYRDFDKQRAEVGAPFADFRCHVSPVQGFNVIIYAHDRLFVELNQYGYLKNYFQTHRNIRFDTLSETGLYPVVAAFYLNAEAARLLDPWDPSDPQAYEAYNYLEVDSLEGFQKFADILRQRQILEAIPQLSPRSRILTLICCATELFSGIPDDNGRFVVIAQRVGA